MNAIAPDRTKGPRKHATSKPIRPPKATARDREAATPEALQRQDSDRTGPYGEAGQSHEQDQDRGNQDRRGVSGIHDVGAFRHEDCPGLVSGGPRATCRR
jgi:hypothetical protein